MKGKLPEDARGFLREEMAVCVERIVLVHCVVETVTSCE